MREIVFLLEEPSAEAMLSGLLPKILPADTQYRCVVFEGKQDLEKQVARRIRAYRVPDAKFVVLRDKDAADCRRIKRALATKCATAELRPVLVRIACHALESWYLADLHAVETGLAVGGLVKLQSKNLYASPDDYPSPDMTLKKIAPSYQKISGSRAIGPHLDPANKRSQSFSAFVDGLSKLCAL